MLLFYYTNIIMNWEIILEMKGILNQRWLILFALPGFLFFLIFAYLPMYGVIISFQDYDIFKGVLHSKFVGVDNFVTIFKMPNFINALKNTVVISLLKLVIAFPAAIVFALLVNEMKNLLYKKVVQTISYLPYFISWVIAAGIWYKFLSIDGGIINDFLVSLHIIKDPVNYLSEKQLFYPIIVLTEIWKNTGFNAIIFIAALASVNQELYEASRVDGAGRLKQIFHISLPGIKSTILLMFILNASNLLKAGQDQLWTMTNITVQGKGEILDTLILRTLKDYGIDGFSIGTAMGIFQAFVGLALFICCNYLSKKLESDSFI